MESYSGSFDVAPSSECPADDAPDQCSLCADGDPVWWYVVEPVTDRSGRLVRSTALARWWAICTECDRLTARGDVDMLRDRLADGLRPAAADLLEGLLRRGVRWGHVTS
jgi:hypothetical protein